MSETGGPAFRNEEDMPENQSSVCPKTTIVSVAAVETMESAQEQKRQHTPQKKDSKTGQEQQHSSAEKNGKRCKEKGERRKEKGREHLGFIYKRGEHITTAEQVKQGTQQHKPFQATLSRAIAGQFKIIAGSRDKDDHKSSVTKE